MIRITSITNALKGIGGEYEINRVVGAFGVIAYVLTACGLVAWDVIIKHREFDIIAFCAAFPAGLGVAVGAIAGAVAWKDKGVASAKVIEQTGVVPIAPPAGPSAVPEAMPTDQTATGESL
jgi:hypothetical protein